MLVVLVGPICSGKTTVAKYLEKTKRFQRVITYTTRPPRKGEVNGVDYHFISEKEFERMIENNELLEYMEYNAVFGHCYYGSAVKEEDLEGRKVIVLNPDGATALRNKIPSKDIFIVYLDVPEYKCLTRAKERGDDIAEVTRRLKDDEIHSFQKFRENRVHDLVIYGAPTLHETWDCIANRLRIF